MWQARGPQQVPITRHESIIFSGCKFAGAVNDKVANEKRKPSEVSVMKWLLRLLALVAFVRSVEAENLRRLANCGDSLESSAVSEVNQERRTRGLQSLACDTHVAKVARDYSAYMCKKRCGVKRNCGHFMQGSAADRLEKAGVVFTRWQENLSWGTNNIRVVPRWMRSSSHRAAVLDGQIKQIGIGHVLCEDGVDYWTMVAVRLWPE